MVRLASLERRMALPPIKSSSSCVHNSHGLKESLHSNTDL
eukprot:COSAG02_NODE_1744_length_11100_cov_6.084083_2_plen_40_part_00